MMKLIYKKMQNAVYARYIMNWKKNRSCMILEGKIDGGGVAFSGAGHGEIVLDSPYATDSTFSIGMWVLVAPAEHWLAGI